VPGVTNEIVTWTIDTNLLLYVSGQGTNTVVVRPKSLSLNGYGFVRANFNDPCGIAQQFENMVRVGAPAASLYTVYIPGYRGVNPVTAQQQAMYTIQIDQVEGATSYSWSLPSGITFASGQTTSGSSVRIWTPSSSGSFTIR
jgi:hypothetical protein